MTQKRRQEAKFAVLRDQREETSGVSFDVALEHFINDVIKSCARVWGSHEKTHFIFRSILDVRPQRYIVLNIQRTLVETKEKCRWQHCAIDVLTGNVLP